ncbi:MULTISPECIES: hypothetical protein [unclassified Sphingobacterium]|uniref:hypothetical protein n=1 Tax=unclassified Sphingobacterium TaxID=2609468 RepID=UPI0025FA2770|nr:MULTISPECIES: hypothetical protein [unclassified Sphingobacterium]
MKFTQTLKHSFAISLLALTTLGFSSCSDNNNDVVPDTELKDTQAKVQSQTLTPSTDSIFYNIKANATSPKANALFSFAGKFYNLDITPTDSANYRFGYFDSKAASVDDINLSVLDTAKIQLAKTLTIKIINNTFPYTNVPNSWYTYNAQNHVLTPIANRYAILYKAPKGTNFNRKVEEAFIVQLNSITQNDDPKTRAVTSFIIKSKNFTK